ncbi:sigma 54-interacting transcriptional regulator [Paraglaciecola aquimarina]|uniref:Sigma 54-interacting transcriptional regulator n=1 Tax=Paraglaciecola aquimarina TaxID=1235557 RepID=A0ABU3SSU5_9ALTE|nr:sigma 54-interacting transcriptional regulator [Paraglaciecola aquimarina]MDU0353089.1 sigma 54-interacting transcriptional regulator [Paraglaciecola aquimarina]
MIVDAGPEISQLLAQPLQKLYGQPWQKVVKIPSPAARARINAIIDSANTIHSATRISTFPIQCTEQIMMMDGFVGPTSEQSIVLILREVASWPVHEWHAQHPNEPVSLLLINPDNLSDINHHYSREQGDEALAEVLQTISGILRDNDFATRYSGAVFAAQLPDTNAKQAQQLTSRLHQLLAGKQYTQHKLSLSFSIGVATIEGQEQIDEQSPLELFRRANTALQAARNIGGGKLVTWRPQFDSNVIANLDRMSGKFSSEPNDDFRVMMLQWDVIRLLGQNHTLQTFAQQSSKLLQSGLKSDYLDFYLLKQGQLTNISANNVNPLTDHSLDSLESWASRQLQLQLKSTARLKSESTVIEQQVCTFIPLMIRQQCEAIILAKWPEKLTPTAKKRAAQLLQLAPNFAATLDRILLLEQEQKRPSLTQQAQGETHQLIFESAAMRTLIQQVQLVGPTDATVLIIGESGTGKELIAQQIHNQSLRPEKPFITVDCSTIVEHLIESELFGHKRGAFTGANNDKLGRIAQADGGTLFLDEVGELPLEIQSKLLRFVQEKTYVAVGDQRVKKVDVRLVLATNRNLAEEVNKGRFRGDLYYRINVFTLHLPDLEQRGTDKLLLARHFISKYAAQYGKSIRDLSTKAEAKIMDYSWPGNVRELQNNIMRSVIVCPGNTIEAEHIVLQHQPQITDKIDSTHIQTVPASPSPFVDLPEYFTRMGKTRS